MHIYAAVIGIFILWHCAGPICKDFLTANNDQTTPGITPTDSIYQALIQQRPR
jgi:hypothetical protein